MKTFTQHLKEASGGLTPQQDMENKLDRLIDANDLDASLEWAKYAESLGWKFVTNQGKWTKNHVKVIDKLIKKYRIKQ